MDIYSLAATQIHAAPQLAPTGTQAEDRYYGSSQIHLPRLGAGALGSLAMTVGVILFFGIALI